ncbi:hypothetical protein QZH41_001597 [Actinostola sp. cb2023]|nr:hypothetical protein QZH41_001597 [Actinostola sp. cb2023]
MTGLLYQIVADLKRHLETKHRTDVNMLDKSNSCFYGLRKILDSEMKEVHMQGITNMKEEKKPFTDRTKKKTGCGKKAF